jgi:hypothetical protein
VSPSLGSRQSVEDAAAVLARECIDKKLNVFGDLDLPYSGSVLARERYRSVLRGVSVRFVGAVVLNQETFQVETFFRFDVLGGRA